MWLQNELFSTQYSHSHLLHSLSKVLLCNISLLTGYQICSLEAMLCTEHDDDILLLAMDEIISGHRLLKPQFCNNEMIPSG